MTHSCENVTKSAAKTLDEDLKRLGYLQSIKILCDDDQSIQSIEEYYDESVLACAGLLPQKRYSDYESEGLEDFLDEDAEQFDDLQHEYEDIEEPDYETLLKQDKKRKRRLENLDSASEASDNSNAKMERFDDEDDC